MPLDSVGRIKLANEQLDAELRKALAVLASAHATDKKSVELSFLGKGTRRVRVGYIQATPIWKTTYRLVLADDKKPLLQGWAIVENTSEDDWSSVNLTLVSGRPISFTMDLYQPLYIPRPQEQLELYSLAAAAGLWARPGAKAEAEFAEPWQRRLQRTTAKCCGAEHRASSGRPARITWLSYAAGTAMAPPAEATRRGLGRPPEACNPPPRRATSATCSNTPLPCRSPCRGSSRPCCRSSMRDVKGEKVSIYNASVQAKHPLYGLRFTNATDLYLMQGPITVFDGGVYAGDAKIEDLPPGSQRLISYGLDLDTEVAPESKSRPEELLSVRLLKGTMIASRKYARAHRVHRQELGKQAKTVLIEYPFDATLDAGVAARSRRKRPAICIALPSRPSRASRPSWPSSEERTDRQQVALTNLDDGTIQFYLSAKVVSDKVKAALAGVGQAEARVAAGRRQAAAA